MKGARKEARRGSKGSKPDWYGDRDKGGTGNKGKGKGKGKSRHCYVAVSCHMALDMLCQNLHEAW